MNMLCIFTNTNSEADDIFKCCICALVLCLVAIVCVILFLGPPLCVCKSHVQYNMVVNHHCDTSLLSQFSGYTPAHLAADKGNLKMIQLLHQHGADMSLKDTVSDTCTFMLTVSTL